MSTMKKISKEKKRGILIQKNSPNLYYVWNWYIIYTIVPCLRKKKTNKLDKEKRIISFRQIPCNDPKLKIKGGKSHRDYWDYLCTTNDLKTHQTLWGAMPAVDSQPPPQTTIHLLSVALQNNIDEADKKKPRWEWRTVQNYDFVDKSPFRLQRLRVRVSGGEMWRWWWMRVMREEEVFIGLGGGLRGCVVWIFLFCMVWTSEAQVWNCISQ